MRYNKYSKHITTGNTLVRIISKTSWKQYTQYILRKIKQRYSRTWKIRELVSLLLILVEGDF